MSQRESDDGRRPDANGSAKKPEWETLADIKRRPEPFLPATTIDRSEPDDTERERDEAVATRDEAQRRAGELRIAPEVAYGLLREGIDLTPSALESVTDDTIARALEQALQNGRFVPSDPGMLGRARSQLADLRDSAAEVSRWLGVEGSQQASKIRAALAKRKVETFEQLRSAEGLRAIEDLGRQFGPGVQRELAGHVALGVIDGDPARRQQLINGGFATLDDIAERPLREFVQAVAQDAGWVQAVQWHAKANAALSYAAKRVLDERVDGTLRVAQGATEVAKSSLALLISGDAASCGCRNCEAATSPTAYLADLLKYCDDSLTRTGGKIDYAYLASSVYQPFGGLPMSCEAVSEPVRQVRIAVEVLRANLRQTTGNRRAGTAAERTYLRQVYETLLVRLGTSSIDLRLAIGADGPSQQRFADRIGIDNALITHGGATFTQLQRMRVDTDTGALDDVEARLESVYGFESTIVDPATRLRQTPRKPEFVEWREEYLRRQWFAQDWPDDSPGTDAPIIDPDVIGPDDFRTPLAANAAFTIWQRRREWIEAQLSQLAGITVPANQSRLDACFAAMSATGAPVTYVPAPGIALATPTWIDPAALTPPPGAVLLGLRAELESNDAARVSAARSVLTTRFGLTPRSYARLLELHAKERAALADTRTPGLTRDELSEAVSILAQSRKQKIIPLWRQEEAAAEQLSTAERLEFGPSQFWISLTEPDEGDSPPVDDGRTPWIDPELVGLSDLPDGEVGARARTAFGLRKDEIETARQNLLAAAAGGGLDAAIGSCYGGPVIATGAATVPAYVDATAAALNSSVATQVALGEQRLRDVLFLDVDSFRRLMTLVARDRQTDPALKPTAAEISAAIAILLGSRKARVLYPRWRTEERAAAPAGLAHWEALKIKLPPWRGSAEVRAAWRRALSLRSAAPVIDPDLIDEGCLVRAPVLVTSPLPATATMADRAALRWKLRQPEISRTLNLLRTSREAQAAAADHGLGALLAIVGWTAAQIRDLGAAAASGRAIGKRLAQLDLDAEAFDALHRIALLIAAGQTVDAAEWDTSYAIITEVWKRRQRQRWRDEERSAGIALDPSAFKVPAPPAGAIAASSPWDLLVPWRARLQDRLDWESHLQGRIDQLATVGTSYSAVLSAAEQACLPGLRDSLVQATSTPLGPTAPLAVRATYLGRRLLIDLQNSGCAMTTRIAQAIETVQNLLFSLRTGQLRDIYPDWAIRADALLEFDAIWNWLGSYATWRAAMFVLLYPENLLVPSLRGSGSPAFWDTIRALRNQGAVDPQQAIDAHAAYRRYFLDVCELEESSLRVSTVGESYFFDEGLPYAHGGTGRTTFLFALTPRARGGRLYWSTFYNDASGRSQQSYWRQLAQFTEGIEEVLGASAYVTPSGRPYLYLVVKTSKDQINHLWFLRFDLQMNGTWDAEPTQINLTGAAALPERFNAALQQTSTTETPRIRVEDPSNSANIVTLYLDRRGESGDPEIRTLGQPNRWSAVASMPNVPRGTHSLHSADTVTVGGAPVTSVEVTVGGMVAVSLRDPAQTDLIVGHVVTWLKRPSDLHLPESRGLIAYYQVLWNVNAQGEPAATSGWIEGPSDSLLRGDQVRACSLAWLPGAAGAASGKLLFFIGGKRDSGSTDSLLYWVGDGLDTVTGQFANWGDPRDAQFPYTIYTTGLGVAVLPVVAGDHEIHLFTSNSGEPANPSTGALATQAKGILRKNTISATGELVAPTWLDHYFDLTGTPGLTTAGLALTAARLKGTETQCLVTCWLSNVDLGENLGYFQVWDGTQWTLAQTVLQSPTGPEPGWFGGDGFGLGIAVADVDKDGRADLLIYHGDFVEPDSAAANGYTRVGYGIGIAPRSIQGGVIPRPYKPNYPSAYPQDFGLTTLSPAQLLSVSSLNTSNTRSNRASLEEMFYFVPIALARALQKSGQYVAALDWFRSVYDYAKPEAQRALYGGLEPNPGGPGIWRDPDWGWIQDPLNPHAIASGRNGVYLRYTLLALIRCLLDYADAEFTRDTSESLPLARTLYLTALQLLNSDALAQKFNGCDDVIDRLTFDYGDIPWLKPMLGHVHLGLLGEAKRFVAEVRAAMSATTDAANQAHRVMALVEEVGGKAPARTLGSALAETRKIHASAALAMTGEPAFRGELVDLAFAVDRGIEFGLSGRFGTSVREMEQYTHVTPRGLENDIGAVVMRWVPEDPPPGGPGLDFEGFGGVSLEDLKRFAEQHFGRIPFTEAQNRHDIPPAGFEPGRHRLPPVEFAPSVMAILACVPPNPVLEALRLRADVNLFKLRTCRNIAGMQRDVDAYAAATDTRTGLPVIGSDGQLSLPGLSAPPATPFRFVVLLERAKSLVQLAQQAETSMFAAIQQADAERYGLLRARQDVQTARAGGQLQTLRVAEAESGRRLVEIQQERGRVVLEYYDGLLNEGLLPEEEVALIMEGIVAASQASAAIGFANVPGSQASAVSFGIQAAASVAGILKEMASFERQRQGWQFQQSLARQDIRITNQQCQIAEDQVRIANQERVIADLQVQHDEAVVEFLSKKFTNVELYDWMGQVMEGVYKYFLQQATSTARLAAGQLGFERQETVPPFIQGDYWRSLSEDGASGGESATAPNRRGLTGSARLLQDITRLEQFAMQTDQRKLQLTKTLSLAQLAPVAVQRFRETGVLTFATPMELFDRDFPGHYLRLVRHVRVSVVALTPPSVGIRATLTSGRISRVVVGGDFFQTVRVQRGPDLVALSSPRDSAGLFDLQMQSDMLGPFEGIGVDATWELRMPKAANPFDYRSIADVLLTIDYTALNSFDYQAQVLQILRPSQSALRAWSFRQNLPDQWYELSNAELSAEPMKVRWTVREDDFTPNALNVSTTGLTVYFVRRRGTRLELPSVSLRYSENGSTGSVGGEAGTVDGLIATSSGNAASWFAMLGRPPVGTWELSLPDTDDMRSRVRDGDIEDILFVLGYTAQLPAWPT